MIRVITTIILAVGVLAGIWYLPLLGFQLAILSAIGLGLGEYSKLVFPDKKTQIFTVLLGLSVAALVTWGTPEMILLGLIFSVFLSFLWEMSQGDPLPESSHRVALIVLAVCYLALPLPFWSHIKADGREWVMLLLFPACLTDTFGYLVGKSIGKRKLAPTISPNKTWEGFFGGLLGGGIFGTWLAYTLFFDGRAVNWTVLFIIGLCVSIVSALGDLIESLIKRSVGVKDSSHLIPGHGGVLDRLDALIFVAPLFYFLKHFI